MKKNVKSIFNFFRGYYFLLLLYFFKKRKIKNAEIVFFFPFYHTGGAEKVHSQIVAALQVKKCIVIFTQGSATTNFLKKFKANATVIEINSIVNKKNDWINQKLKCLLYSTINQSNTIQTIFSSNSPYFYNLLSYLNPDLKIIDLYHSFSQNDSREKQLIDSAIRINKRIVISQKTKRDIISYYNKNNINQELIKRIEVIENAVMVPEILDNKTNKNMVIGFVGRWSEEKRPEVFLSIANMIQIEFPEIEFVMAGSGIVSNYEVIQENGVKYLGDLFEENQIIELYRKIDLLLLPSVYEGFPMVIMEAMSYGVIPIATDVGGISEHLQNNTNGILIENSSDEFHLATQFVKIIKMLVREGYVRDRMSKNAFEYAQNNFDIEQFNKSYQELLN
ncbi:hypothetical protein GCM10008015_31860 [Flavobacterium palustre]|uniref:Glycosyl transferase family 1 domain-containing protein n=1 Tax=Flavobacterium palustre TaxID=1476463 RepID=A0ABQ1HTI6_9FLAO|nr:glycosyltransferase family 4 protein [Flavobacterium palustre]GGA88970.1 hypothetical protein GCM10008015_31860 [Flavobacterium palustre]